MTKASSFITFIVAITLFACSEKSNTPTGTSSKTTTAPKKEKVVDGQKIYTQYCVICHGKDGTQELNGAYNLPQSTLSLEERIAIITNGRKLMTPFKGTLNEAEIKAVAAYTLKLKAQ